ncbi:hypothetical protein C7N43_11760 [Sphingobacteriales bacterium UPWRP_1]|nr:hypothetical protein B6N25_13520 [Sphingobacteriales bacterium TSM_CSS]PSJ76804.1 hypothetical protein C7N43_11760 [Sphingobacteriales bacterium UPWRP_1]
MLILGIQKVLFINCNCRIQLMPMNGKCFIAIVWLVLCIPFQKATAQLYCTNATALPVWIAVAYHETPKIQGEWQPGRWVAEGWLLVMPDDTIQLTTHIGASAQFGLAYEFYYFAYQIGPNGKMWTGQRSFLVELDEKKEVKPYSIDFHINNADNAEAYPEYPFLVPFQFRYATGQRSGSYLITLRQYD